MSDPRNALAAQLLDALLDAQRADADAALIEALDILTERSGKNKYRYAGSILRGTKLGRHEIDDREALKRIAAYPADRRSSAVSTVARQLAGPEASNTDVETIANRLRSKIRKNKNGGNGYHRRGRPLEKSA